MLILKNLVREPRSISLRKTAEIFVGNQRDRTEPVSSIVIPHRGKVLCATDSVIDEPMIKDMMEAGKLSVEVVKASDESEAQEEPTEKKSPPQKSRKAKNQKAGDDKEPEEPNSEPDSASGGGDETPTV